METLQKLVISFLSLNFFDILTTYMFTNKDFVKSLQRFVKAEISKLYTFKRFSQPCLVPFSSLTWSLAMVVTNCEELGMLEYI